MPDLSISRSSSEAGENADRAGEHQAGEDFAQHLGTGTREQESSFAFQRLPVELRERTLLHVQDFPRDEANNTIRSFRQTSHDSNNLVQNSLSLRAFPAYSGLIYGAGYDIRYQGLTLEQAAHQNGVTRADGSIHPEDRAQLQAVVNQVAASGGVRAHPGLMDTAGNDIRYRGLTLEQAARQNGVTRADGSIHPEDRAQLQAVVDQVAARSNTPV